MKKVFFMLVAATAMFSACDKKEDSKAGTFKGEEVSIGNGKAWAWVQQDDDSKPVAMGITLTAGALVNLPNGPAPHHGVSYLLKLPAEKSSTPFNHISMDWNSIGHEPSGIYDKPHFDFHYYMITEAAQQAIPAYEQDSAKFKNSPDAAYLPANHMNFGGGVPQMGAHWLDVTSPELNPNNPAPFTQTFIYGTYDGKVTFMEPMITKAFIEATTTFERTIPQPAKFQKTGYYPTRMRIHKHNGEVEIILDAFVYRQQS